MKNELLSRFSKIFWSLLITAILSLACIFLSGCNNFGVGFNAADAEKAVNTTYLAEVNSLSKEFSKALDGFQSDVKEKNINNMQEKVKSIDSIIEQFNSLSAPESCQDIHQAYKDGYIELQQALSNYVQVYSDFVSGQIDNTVLNQRIANVQQSYNQGIELVKKADKLAAEK